MSRLKDNRFSPNNPWARRANQEWELAGIARQDNDMIAAAQHTKNARDYETNAHAWEEGQ